MCLGRTATEGRTNSGSVRSYGQRGSFASVLARGGAGRCAKPASASSQLQGSQWRVWLEEQGKMWVFAASPVSLACLVTVS